MLRRFLNRAFQSTMNRLFNLQAEDPEQTETPQAADPKTKEEETSPVNVQTLTSYGDQKSEEVAERPAQLEASAEPGVDATDVEKKIVEIIGTVYDPEIPVNIYELGLIYETRIEPSGMAHVKMTLTSPNCPAAATLPAEVESKVRSVPGVRDVVLDLVFDPPWNPDMMSEAAKLELGML